MRNFINKIKSKFQKAAVTAKVAVENKRAEGYIDTAVKIIIGVVIGGVILAGLYTLFNTTVVPSMQTEIGNMFTYSGT